VTVACHRKDPWPPLYIADGIINGIDHQDYVLMQYTGLKDKNGKEIYEGDIVRHATDEGVYKVIFEDGGFYVKNLFEYDFQTINEYPLEVIGNIFEDKHLLKEESKWKTSVSNAK